MTPGHPLDDVHYREYKLILRPDRFTTRQGFADYAQVVRRAAKAAAVPVTGLDRAIRHRVREVLFYDTERFDLYNNSFILRTRRLYDDGWPHPEHELTFKYRHRDVDVAAAVDVRPTIACDSEIRFKEELLPLRDRIGGIRSLFSHNSILHSPAMTMAALRDIARVFPALGAIAVKGTTKIDLVNRTAVEEVFADMGQLHFGHGLKAKITLALWRDRGSQQPLVAEFGYQMKFARYNKLHHKQLHRSEDLLKRVQLVAKDWVWTGTTKTAIVYGLGGRRPKNHE